jgi:hypothetical protein
VSETCPGPLVWFSALAANQEESGAVLECGTCGYIIATGSFNDEAHAETPVLREGVGA